MDHEGIISHGGLRHLIDLPLLPRPGLRTTLISGWPHESAAGIVGRWLTGRSKSCDDTLETTLEKRSELFRSGNIQAYSGLGIERSG